MKLPGYWMQFGNFHRLINDARAILIAWPWSFSGRAWKIMSRCCLVNQLAEFQVLDVIWGVAKTL